MGCASSAVQVTDYKLKPNRELQADICVVYYFPLFARASPINLMLSHAGKEFKFVAVSVPEWISGVGKKKYGSLPVVERSDGTFMKETVPIARYIAQHNDYYPVDPMECYKNDWFVEKFQPVINGMH